MSKQKFSLAGLLDDIGYWIARRTGEFLMTEAVAAPDSRPDYVVKIDRMRSHAERVSRRLKG